ncbi:uncharacterized protein LOC124860077 [Girardinichthys multiradiatus]|uniref:uncharacterized protein LOC124860077 n=1 Tax=Girardinichthys multiradiatus TaxID=208333 RepID=UPI001FAD603E|nr:uncharacterized protein LOC124860077 [Girardinichthys multiradiatus]
MYWFRTESERFDPGIIYTQRNINDKDLERSCSYSLSVRDSSDAGLYYSAVVTCGSILFGEGTKVETTLIHTLEASHLISLTLVDIGDNVTFDCNVSEKDLKFVYFYKQSLGYMIETVGSVFLGKPTISEKFKDSRFALTAEGSPYKLTISNVSKKDEATYLCHTGTTYSQKFINETLLVVKDHKQQNSLYLEQHPKTELVQQGETVTLQCSLLSKNKEKVQCPTKPSMYWFRTESERFDPGIIYTQRNISDKDLERSCSYSLSVRDSSDAGLYYSAVVTCGSILFGEGTKVETRLEYLEFYPA